MVAQEWKPEKHQSCPEKNRNWTTKKKEKSNIIPAKKKKYRKKRFTKRFLQKYHENRVCCSR